MARSAARSLTPPVMGRGARPVCRAQPDCGVETGLKVASLVASTEPGGRGPAGVAGRWGQDKARLLERCGRWQQSSWWVRRQWEQESRAAPGSWLLAASAEGCGCRGWGRLGGSGRSWIGSSFVLVSASAVWVLRGSSECAGDAG